MRIAFKITPALLFIDSNLANALTGSQYGLIQDSGYLVLWLACSLLSYSIYLALKGGSLGIPWLVFIVGFSIAAGASVIQLLDSLKLVFGVYDLRSLILILKLGAILVLISGLILYRRGLE